MNLFKEVEGQDMIESEMKVIPAILSGKVIIIHKLEKFGHFGMIPILTMIPVRENSEVVIICPDIPHFSAFFFFKCPSTAGYSP